MSAADHARNSRIEPGEMFIAFARPVAQGLAVRLVLQREAASGELDLGEEGRFYPTDEALQRWREGSHGEASVVYE